MNLENFDKKVELARRLIEIDNELREVEDDYLESWLMKGMPDGEADNLTTLFDDLDEYGLEWLSFGDYLLNRREEEPYEED